MNFKNYSIQHKQKKGGSSKLNSRPSPARVIIAPLIYNTLTYAIILFTLKIFFYFFFKINFAN